MLESALIYLAAAIVAVPIAKRLGLGSVLGYLLAGILIGPFLLGLVGDQTNVMHFAEFGVVMMLFLVGLELHPSRLWKLRHSIIGLGGLGFQALGLALPMLGGNPLCADIRDEPLAVARERGCKTFDLTLKKSIQEIKTLKISNSEVKISDLKILGKNE